MKRADPMRAARQSRHDANARKRQGRAAPQAAFGSWTQRVRDRGPAKVGPSPLQLAAASLSLGALFANDEAMERMFGDRENNVYRCNAERYPETIARIERLRGRGQ